MRKIVFLISILLGFIYNSFSQTMYGCLVTDNGNRRLYTVAKTTSPTLYTANCGGISQSNLRAYEGSSVVIGANCSWTPGVMDVPSHTCYIPSGGFCGKLGTYVLACPLDNYTWTLLLFAGCLGAFFLRKYFVLLTS